MIRIRTALWSLFFACFAFHVNVNAQVTSEAGTSHGSRWSIAIHGGAGGNPRRLSAEQRKLRLDGMREVLQLAKDKLENGATALDTVEAVLRVLEDNPTFNAGRGAVLTTKGEAQLDASIMDGSTKACGAVGGVTIVKHPISLARMVMSDTPHVLLVGPGANEFARQQKVELVEPSYFLLKPKEADVSAAYTDPESYVGTVGCAVLDTHGNLAAGTTTGGTARKLPGRIGDSPIVGAGTYADNASCAISGTGVGEEYIRNAIAYDVSARMRYLGENVQEAVRNAMEKTLKPNTGGLIAVGHDGMITLQHNTIGMACAAANSEGRFETWLISPESSKERLDD